MNRTKVAENGIQTLSAQLIALEGMNTAQLKNKWREVFGEDSRSHNRQYLMKRLQYRIQEQAQGGISEAARQRILELASTSTLRYRGAPSSQSPAVDTMMPNTQATPIQEQAPCAPVEQPQTQAHPKDPRLPAPGTLLQKQFQGERVEVKVLDEGFEFKGRTYKSLSKIARIITGTHWNGFVFFGLKKAK